MALTTLPMPPEGMLDDGIVEHYWSGPRLGNSTTCSIQGFCFVFGLSCMLLYNASLWTYYACAIAFEIEEGRIKKYIEGPFLHFVPLLISAIFACIPVVLDLYNPIGSVSWCTINSISGSSRRRGIFFITASTALWIFVHIITCFALVVRRVVKNQRILYLLLVVGREEPVLVVTGLSIVQGDREKERERADERERIIEEYEKRKEQKKLELMGTGIMPDEDGDRDDGNRDEEDNRNQKNVNWDDNFHDHDHDHDHNDNKNGNQAPQSSSPSGPHAIDVDYVAAQSMTSFGDLSTISPSLQLYYYERSTLGPPSENDEATEAHSKSKGISRFFAPSMHLY